MREGSMPSTCNKTYNMQEIEEHIVSWYLRPEKKREQMRILSLWKMERENLHARYRWPKTKLESWQIEQLCLLVDWAFETVPFYRECYASCGYELGSIRSLRDFSTLPTLSKEDISQYFEKMISEEFDKKDCRWFTSTGSSGKPLQLLMQSERTEYDTLYRMRMFEIMSNTTLDPKRWIYNINHATWWHSSFLGHYPVVTVSQKAPVKALKQHISQVKPQFIATIASALEKLTDEPSDIAQLGVVCISTNSETTSKTQRKRWSDKMGIPVRDEYSSEELGLLAFECHQGEYHLVEDDTYVEVEVSQPDSPYGEVIGTDLWNFAMPVIRYRQGDLISFHKENESATCACGSQFRQIRQVLGRVDDCFNRCNGERVTSGELLEIAESLLSDDRSGIAEFRIVQENMGRISLYLEPRNNNGYDKNIISQFQRQLERLLQTPQEFFVKRLVDFPSHERKKRKIFYRGYNL